MSSLANSSGTTYVVYEPSSPPPPSSSSSSSVGGSRLLASSSRSDPTQPRRPPPLPRSISDMDISDPSGDEHDSPDTSIDASHPLAKPEPAADRGIPPELAAKLTSALLNANLYTKGQIPTTVQQLIKQADPNASRSSTPTPIPKRPSYLPPRPSPPSLLLPLLSRLSLSLQQAFADLATLAPLGPASTPGPVVMFLTGPSLLLPKAMFGVQLPPLVPSSSSAHDEREWDAVERAVLRGLMQMRGYGSGGDGIAPSKTHLLLLAPRSFSSLSWLPRQTLSPRLSSLLFSAPPPPPPPPAPSSQPRPRAMLKKKAKGPEVEFVRVIRGEGEGAGGVKVEDARGVWPAGVEGEGQEGHGDGEMIWWMWEGGVIEGWREK